MPLTPSGRFRPKSQIVLEFEAFVQRGVAGGVGGVVEHGSQDEVVRRGREVQPGTATSEFPFVRKNPGPAKPENAEEGETDASLF